MRASPPALLPILRSGVQGDVLATAYLSPDRGFSVTELASLARASLKATAQEVGRLVDAGLPICYSAKLVHTWRRLARRPLMTRSLGVGVALVGALSGCA